ncbi:MgtC/SapB family protein [Pusillimonas sp. SM2304]|uniref:MgtC/SapB family protein n=1 Tax=Pusillimonas sp. SM2304 TaxID=3073241 RepID=UPI002876A312|nr:MgtC/SapB family protein [Pusillimonas sp. SM2304]MDS1140555.1 MgtC/SapB family protein [Pusillimonas sp. SM2304]
MPEIASSVWTTIVQEFSDIPDASEATRVILRLGMAILLGAAIGYERERRGKAAGLRTHMLVSLGSAIFVLVPLQTGMAVPDMSRVLQGVIAGIGFLGAGAILKVSSGDTIKGLTTAASIWVAAGIGIAAGMGRETTAMLSTLAALFILVIVRRLESEIDRPAVIAARSRSSSKADAG